MDSRHQIVTLNSCAKVLGVMISGIYYASGKWKNKSIVAKMKSEENR